MTDESSTPALANSPIGSGASPPDERRASASGRLIPGLRLRPTSFAAFSLQAGASAKCDLEHAYSPAMELDLEWDRPIRRRRGAPQRLCGILVFYDFRWLDVFPDRRTHFKHGQRLAEGVQERCPEGLEPALLLTRRTDVAQGLRTTPTYFLYLLNIDEWLAAEDDFSLAYLANHLAVEPEDIGRYADLSLLGDPADVAKFFEEQLTVDRVAEWLQQDGERIERLAGLVDFRVAAPTDVQHALDAVTALGDLDEHQLQELVDFVSRLTDSDQRAVLFRGATTDQPGREAAAFVLHERVAERVADAGRDLENYRSLLDNPCATETDMQDFLATHPLLFGLEYASIRPQQSGPSGSMDFLLERFDGYKRRSRIEGARIYPSLP